jgi:hypothetical protein
LSLLKSDDVRDVLPLQLGKSKVFEFSHESSRSLLHTRPGNLTAIHVAS